jgi:5-methyltetrahydrofolate--homocysteine methyltransferase
MLIQKYGGIQMIIIGEKINSTIKSVQAAIENYDTKTIETLVISQYEAGASYIDVNAGMFTNDEPKRLEWLVKTVQNVINAPLSLDSPRPEALKAALKVYKKGNKPIINSITYEKDRFNSILNLITEYETGIIALCMDDEGMPETTEQRVRIADKLINALTKEGIPLNDIFIDPMVRPIGTGPQYGVLAIETIRKVKQEYPDVHIACGLSNISFGMPARKIINQAFLILAMGAGMDGAILNPLDKKLMSYLYATEALLGQDEYSINYLTKFREGKIEI